MDLQKIILLGHATHDAETIESKNGKPFAKFGLATNRFLGKDKGSEVTFYECLVFGEKQIEKVTELIKKGDRITVDGRPNTDAYISKDGEAKAAVSVIVDYWNVMK